MAAVVVREYAAGSAISLLAQAADDVPSTSFVCVGDTIDTDEQGFLRRVEPPPARRSEGRKGRAPRAGQLAAGPQRPPAAPDSGLKRRKLQHGVPVLACRCGGRRCSPMQLLTAAAVSPPPLPPSLAHPKSRGHGTQVIDGRLVATLCGVVERVNKLVYVKPLRARYGAEVGDVVVGRVTEVVAKKWKVDLQSRQEASLQLSAVNLPGGIQARAVPRLICLPPPRPLPPPPPARLRPDLCQQPPPHALASHPPATPPRSGGARRRMSSTCGRCSGRGT